MFFQIAVKDTDNYANMQKSCIFFAVNTKNNANNANIMQITQKSRPKYQGRLFDAKDFLLYSE